MRSLTGWGIWFHLILLKMTALNKFLPSTTFGAPLSAPLAWASCSKTWAAGLLQLRIMCLSVGIRAW
jgi:hypothetical protein